jgi:hypothetical protein
LPCSDVVAVPSLLTFISAAEAEAAGIDFSADIEEEADKEDEEAEDKSKEILQPKPRRPRPRKSPPRLRPQHRRILSMR